MGHNFISEVNKLDIGLKSSSFSSATTGKYYPLNLHRKALFMATLGVMAAGVTSQIQLVQALDAEGTDSKVITDAVATVTANVNGAVLKLAIVTATVHVAGQTVTISVDGEDYVFTAAAADNPLTREYAIGADGAASAANLLAKINSADENIGVPGIIGVASVETTNSIITLKSEEPGENAITAVASAATTIVSTVEAIAYVEVDSSALDVNNGFSHIAVQITNSASTLAGASLLRGDCRYTPDQNVAASKIVLA